MPSDYTPVIQQLLDEFERLPGVGPKGAQRMVYWLLNTEKATALRLAEAIVKVKEEVHFCPRCFNYAQDDVCHICSAINRDSHTICVVSEPQDVAAIERSGSYRGLYHVLGGALSPMDGIGPDDLHISQLLNRLATEPITEVLLATNPNIEGETTATYLARLIKPLDIKVTRLASGLPVGGDLEYAAEETLARAIELRQVI
ncbi:MAG: recombination protein RecR [Eggerthellaceae bacterium]|nr:recombination protein RecR [Eggerthellaceae bacterium]